MRKLRVALFVAVWLLANMLAWGSSLRGPVGSEYAWPAIGFMYLAIGGIFYSDKKSFLLSATVLLSLISGLVFTCISMLSFFGVEYLVNEPYYLRYALVNQSLAIIFLAVSYIGNPLELKSLPLSSTDGVILLTLNAVFAGLAIMVVQGYYEGLTTITIAGYGSVILFFVANWLGSFAWFMLIVAIPLSINATFKRFR